MGPGAKRGENTSITARRKKKKKPVWPEVCIERSSSFQEILQLEFCMFVRSQEWVAQAAEERGVRMWRIRLRMMRVPQTPPDNLHAIPTWLT